MKFILLLLFILSSNVFAQRVSTIDADCVRIKDGICIDKLEFGMLENASANIQVQIDAKADDSDTSTALSGKVGTTGDESVAGVKTFTSQIVATSTANGFRPCPVMTEIQRDAIAAPVLGDCVTNSNSLTLNVYNGSIWKAAGGGLSNWETSFGYAENDIVIESNKIYQCAIAHTSGTFATDLAAVKWVRVSTDVSGATGVLPLAGGGSNKNLTASDGAIVYSDTDSLELLAPGTAGQVLQTNGVAAPTFVNKSISGKAQNLSAITLEEMQVPNNLLTATDTNKYLNETGNKNILVNPSFEHSTADSSWTNDGTEVGVVEPTTIIDGLKSLKFLPSAETINLVQSSTLYQANFADGVQGLAMVRIKSDIALTVCAVQAGTVSTTDCVTTATDSKWGLYKIPFILGATSNGISIVSASATGTVYIDDAFVGAVDVTVNGFLSQQSYSIKQATNALTNRNLEIQFALVTATIVNSGTPLIVASDDAGATRTRFTASAPSMIQINWSTGIAVSGNSITIYKNGSSVILGENASANNFIASTSYNMTLSTGDYFTVGTEADTSNTTSPANLSFTATSGPTSTYSSQCGANCVDTFSAKVSSSAVTSAENSDFINGNCVYGAGDTTCTFNAGIFTVAPNCTAITAGASGTTASVTSVSSTNVVIRTKTGITTDAQYAFNLSCQKQGADFVASRTIQGSFKEVNVSPGITKPKTCHYAFGGAGATLASPTECTTGTCVEVYDSCGTASPPAWVTTGRYNDLTFASGTWASNSFIDCKCTGFDVSADTPSHCINTWQTSDNSYSSNSNGGAVLSFLGYNESGTQKTIYGAITCTGSAP